MLNIFPKKEINVFRKTSKIKQFYSLDSYFSTNFYCVHFKASIFACCLPKIRDLKSVDLKSSLRSEREAWLVDENGFPPILMLIYNTGCYLFFIKMNKNKRVSWKAYIMTLYLLLMIFNQWDPGTATPIEEVCEPQDRLCRRINLIWSYFMRVSWSAYELFRLGC